MKALLIGCGAMGLRHALTLKNMGIEIAGVVDISSDALQAGIDKGLYNSSAAFTDPDKAFSEAEVDLVVISTTAPLHHEYLRRAAERGVKYVLCEKPLAPSLGQCEDMLRICSEHSIRCAVNHQRRFIDHYHMLKEMSMTGSLGPFTAFQVNAGNFGIAMNGSHYIEIASHLFGERFASVTGWLSDDELPNPRGEQFKDFAGCIRATTEAGKRFYLDASTDQYHGLNVVIASRHGQVQIDDLAGKLHINQRKVEHVDAPSARYGMPSELTNDDFSVDIVTVNQRMLEALLNDGDYPTLEDGLHTIQVLVAAQMSNEQGNKEVNLVDTAAQKSRVFPWA